MTLVSCVAMNNTWTMLILLGLDPPKRSLRPRGHQHRHRLRPLVSRAERHWGGGQLRRLCPLVRVSWADAGSGVFGFLVTAVVLGLITCRKDPAGRVVGAAAIAGIVA